MSQYQEHNVNQQPYENSQDGGYREHHEQREYRGHRGYRNNQGYFRRRGNQGRRGNPINMRDVGFLRRLHRDVNGLSDEKVMFSRWVLNVFARGTRNGGNARMLGLLLINSKYSKINQKYIDAFVDVLGHSGTEPNRRGIFIGKRGIKYPNNMTPRTCSNTLRWILKVFAESNVEYNVGGDHTLQDGIVWDVERNRCQMLSTISYTIKWYVHNGKIGDRLSRSEQIQAWKQDFMGEMNWDDVISEKPDETLHGSVDGNVDEEGSVQVVSEQSPEQPVQVPVQEPVQVPDQ